MTENWLFPVGHYLGPFYPGAGAPLQSYRVRVGDEVVTLATETELLVWGLAHGAAVAPPGTDRVWTRADVADLAAQRVAADLTGTFDDLLAVGALVEVGPDGVDPAIFVRTHRLHPFLAGLGTGPGRPDRYRIGVLGEEPAAVVDAQTFDLWQWAPRVDSLWALGDMQASTASVLGDETGVPALLHRVHRLLAAGCGYLDAVSVPAASAGAVST